MSIERPEVRVHFFNNQKKINITPWHYNEAEINAMLKSKSVQVRDTVYYIEHTLFDASTRALIIHLEDVS